MASIQKQKNSKFLYLVWWQDGKQHWKSTGTEDAALAERALQELKAVLAGERREGKIREVLELAGKMVVESSRLPLAAAWAAFEQQPQQRKVEKETRGAKKSKLEAFVKWVGEKHPEVKALHEVSERMALEYMTGLAELAGGTRNSTLTDLRGIWEALRIPLGIGNPWSAVRRVEARHVPHKAFTLDQVRDIYRVAQDFEKAGRGEGNFWPAAVMIGYRTGLRFGDVCELSWDEVDWEAQRLVVWANKGKGKAKKPVVHPLHPEIARFLQARLNRKGADKLKGKRIWPDTARRYGQRNRLLYEEMHALFEAAGIVTKRDKTAEDGARRRQVKEYGFHSLRTTYATLLDDAGAARADVQSLMGHAQESMTAHYSRSTAAGARVAGMLPELGEKRKNGRTERRKN
jgi:integrase